MLRPCAATNGQEDRDGAVAQGGIERPCSPGTGEVAGSSPASVTISMKKAVRAEWASCGVEGHLGEIRNTDYGIREFGFVDRHPAPSGVR
jgi:hypothetical protein